MGKQSEFAWKLPRNLCTKWVIFALYWAIVHSYWAVYVQYCNTHFLSRLNKCRKLRVFCVNFLPWSLRSCKSFEKSQVWICSGNILQMFCECFEFEMWFKWFTPTGMICSGNTHGWIPSVLNLHNRENHKNLIHKNFDLCLEKYINNCNRSLSIITFFSSSISINSKYWPAKGRHQHKRKRFLSGIARIT